MTQDPNQLKPGEAVGALVKSVMHLGASIAQTVAEAASGKAQEQRAGDTDLQAIIRHGTTAAGSIIATVVSATEQGSNAQKQEPQTAGPKIAAGNTLRVPLSIDNPGTDALENIAPVLLEITCEDAEIVFEPDQLTIGPRDFEKLVVLIHVPDTCTPDQYRLSFDLNRENKSTSRLEPVVIPFEVV